MMIRRTSCNATKPTALMTLHTQIAQTDVEIEAAVSDIMANDEASSDGVY